MLPIIHHPAYDAATVSDDHRFPMRKYSLLAEALRQRGHSFLTPEPATREQLIAAHAPGYVDAILDGTLGPKAARRIGFDITPAIADRSRAAVGGTIQAADMALQQGLAVNLAGGSHHADTEGGAGFCVFNDVGIAARALLDRARIDQIAVIDLDVHHGDGTALIFADETRVFTASLHCEENWPRKKPPSDLDIGLPKGSGDQSYLAALNQLTDHLRTVKRPDLIFYNAGVDPHADDRLGLLNLSNEGLRARERAVLSFAAAHAIPVAIVMGGGYSKDASAVAARHMITVETALELYAPA